MSHSNRSSPNHSPFPFKKTSLTKTTRHPAKFFTIHSFQNPNPMAKPSSILLTEENASTEQESTYPSTSLKSSRESVSNILNARVVFSPERTMQKVPLFEIKDSIYELPSHKITPIASLSDLDADEDLESIDVERRNIVNDIKISLQAIHDRKSSSMHKSKTCRASPGPVGGNINPCLAKNSLPMTSLKNIKGRSYGGASNVQYQYSRHAATTNQDMDYYFSNNMSQKSLKSQKSKPVSLNKYSFTDNNVPATARMMTSNLLKGKDSSAFNHIVFEPPKTPLPKAFTSRMKLKEYLSPNMNHTPILIKTLDEQLSSRGREMENANRTTTAWSIKHKSSGLLSFSPVKAEPKMKANSQSRTLL